MADLLSRIGTSEAMALALAFGACILDLRTRRIPNALTLGGAVGACVYALAFHGARGLTMSLAGWAAGLAIFLPFFLLRGLGAGDVKLMACLGAWLGPGLAVWSALYAALAGGVLALIVALASGYFRRMLENVYLLLAHFRVAGVRPHPELRLDRGKGPRLPYAVPIAVGTLAAMWLH